MKLFFEYCSKFLLRGLGFISIILLFPTGYTWVTGKSWILQPWAWSVILVITVFFAGFLAYLDSFREYIGKELKVVIREVSSGVNTGAFHNITRSRNQGETTTTISYHAQIVIDNEMPTTQHVSIKTTEIETNWELKRIGEQKIEFKLNRDSIKDLSIPGSSHIGPIIMRVSQVFDIPVEHPGRSLASLTNVEMELLVEPLGGKAIAKPIPYDIAKFHESIEEQFKSIITHTHPEILPAYSEYIEERASVKN